MGGCPTLTHRKHDQTKHLTEQTANSDNNAGFLHAKSLHGTLRGKKTDMHKSIPIRVQGVWCHALEGFH